mgnify:CR=1 FL=1
MIARLLIAKLGIGALENGLGMGSVVHEEQVDPHDSSSPHNGLVS